MDALNGAFAQLGIGAPQLDALAVHLVDAQVQQLLQADNADGSNKNPWIRVARRNAGRTRREGPRPEQEVIPPVPERVCTREVLWVQNGRTIRARRKQSMARKCCLTCTPEGEAVLVYGSFGRYGFEY